MKGKKGKGYEETRNYYIGKAKIYTHLLLNQKAIEKKEVLNYVTKEKMIQNEIGKQQAGAIEGGFQQKLRLNRKRLKSNGMVKQKFTNDKDCSLVCQKLVLPLEFLSKRLWDKSGQL